MHAAAACGLPWVATFACDTPLLPPDIVARLGAAVADGAADLACAASGGRRHPLMALWPARLAHALDRAVAEEGVREVGAWAARHRLAIVELPVETVDPFLNINTPDDLAAAERLLCEVARLSP
jgi:molybdopterin-guanine dinucleotide biosynthesis protein A